MDKDTIIDVAPYFAAELEIGDRADVGALRREAARLADLAREAGTDVTASFVDTELAEVIWELLALDDHDTILGAVVLPVHETFVADDNGREFTSSFLAVDFKKLASTPRSPVYPDYVLRVFFLQVGAVDAAPANPDMLFPYFVVVSIERFRDGSEVVLDAVVAHGQRFEHPLGTTVPTQQVDDPKILNVMLSELQKVQV